MALVSLPAWAGREAIDALPVAAKLGDRFTLRGKLSPARAQQLLAIASSVEQDVKRRFGSGANPAQVPMCLFETAKEYAEFNHALLDGGEPPSELGFYDPTMRVVVANVGLSIGNLRHEMTHALVADDFPGIPSWLTEGIGSLYGTAVLKDGRYVFVANYRLKHLREAKKDGTLPTLHELVTAPPEVVYGPKVMAFYGLVRHLLLYLDRQGTLSKFYAEFRAAKVEDREKVLLRYVDEKKFLAWTDSLVIGQ
ncbi:MAG: hypothetical protein QM723_32765 [Myxococcaceae bacterium]